jgi:peroxiredoxin
MRPLVALVIVLALVVAAAAVGLFTSSRPPRADTSSAVSPDSGPGAPSPPVAGSAPPPARPGKVFALPDAVKELDLIRPARAKLAEDFVLPTTSGGPFKLSAHRGRVVMVNFWATWCPPCLEEMPAMERLYRQHKDAGFTLIAVSVDGDPALVGPFVARHRFTFPVALDTRMDLANSYTVRALPSSFIVARDGTLAALAIGPRHWDSDAAHSLVEGLAR